MLPPLQSGGAGSPGLLQATNSKAVTRVNKGIAMRQVRFIHPLLAVVPILQAGGGKQAAGNHPRRA